MIIEPRAVKDEESAHPIAGSWRPIFRDVVKAFAEDDFELSQVVPGVAPVDPSIASQNRAYVRNYGELLVELPEDTWATSCAQWMGQHWEVLVDLYIKGEGASDLVLTGHINELNGKPQFTVGLIYVP
ncbi:hypothetical protein [Reinekea sp. G2M2-21]|uniref:DUF7668 domain-containing protein n=1 Tax=Reinekea sp. G2M2-21 TaxID=2788942 RepID=UPI0018A97CDB|nr:hypothetical protein [Reinekea sp. G2M2-21]